MNNSLNGLQAHCAGHFNGEVTIIEMTHVNPRRFRNEHPTNRGQRAA